MTTIRLLSAAMAAAFLAQPVYAQTPPAQKPAAKPAAPKPATPAAKPAAPASTAAKPTTPAPAAKPAAPASTAAKPAAPAPATAAKPQPKPAAPAAAATPAAKPAGDDQPTLLGQYADWGAYSATPEGKKLCFALAKPGSSQTVPPNRPRDPAFLYLSTRPGEKVKDEISVIIGYDFKPNSEATAVIGPTTFAMYTQDDTAWIKNPADEAKLVETLRKGADIVVKGTSAKGTQTTDTFSLKGLAQALDKVAQECK